MKRLKVKELTTGMVLREISLAKNNLINLEEFRSLYEGDKTMLKIADIYETYDLEKQTRLLMDFDDLLVEAYRLLSENDQVREKYRSIFRHLLVDEYQDTNPVQMEILKILVNGDEEDASFWACGDDWQAIYAFTGASVANILNFRDMFPGADQMILELQLPINATDPPRLPEPHPAQYQEDRQGASNRQC